MNIDTLKTYLIETGLTQAAFADLAGLKPVDISRTMNDRRKPSTRVALAIDKATKGAVPFRAWFDTKPQSAAQSEGV